MTEQVTPDTVVDPGGEHAVFEGVAQRVEGMAWRLEQTIRPQELVHDCAQGGAVAVAWEALGILPEGFQRDARQRDHAAGVVAL